MNRRFHVNRLFQILYPLLVYFVFYQAMDFLFLLLIGSVVSPLTCLLLSALVTLFPVVYLYRRAPIVKAERAFRKEDLKTDCISILMVVFVGVGLNILITYLPFSFYTGGYEKAAQTLYSGSVLVKVLCNAIAVPVLEEILYRGIIAGQLEIMYHNKKIAILLSAVLFGILHFNVVQFMYACICGVFLGYIYLKNHKIWVPIVAHGLTNLVVILCVTYL